MNKQILMIAAVLALVLVVGGISGCGSPPVGPKIGSFVNSVKSDIDDAWISGTEANMTSIISFSTRFDKVCFANLSTCSDAFCAAAKAFGYSDENLFLVGKNNEFGIAEKYGAESGIKITCNGIDCISLNKNPACYAVKNGDVAIRLSTGEKYGCVPGKVCIF